MKVLLLTTDAYGVNGGIALYNRDLIESLASMPEIDEIVVMLRNKTPNEIAKINKVNIVKQSQNGKISFIKSVLAYAKDDFDLVICGHINLLPVAALVSLVISAPLVLMIYGIDVWHKPYPLSKIFLKPVDAVWSISEITRERMNKWATMPSGVYTTIPNAIHLEYYGLSQPRLELQERHGLKGATVIMTLARLPGKERYKGIDEVLEIMPSLLKEIPNLKYLIVGEGSDRERLMGKVKFLGLTDHVVFTGMISEVDKADYLRLANAFVMPGRGEGFGFVFLEALACGVPTVGSLIDGSREALRNGELGELANPNDLSSICDCILRALSKPRSIPHGLAYFDWVNFKNRVSIATLHVIESYKSKRKLI